jgi:hypothetical protein
LTSWAITVADALHPVFLRQYDGSELDAAIDMDTEQKLVALRKEVEEKLTHSEFARADSAADNARHVARIDAFREVLALIDAS